MNHIASALVGSLIVLPLVSVAQTDAGPFEKFINRDAPECVPESQIKDMSTVIDLTPDQFQFVRALYIALPPVSKKLPEGDSAIMAVGNGGEVMLALVDDKQVCARFMAPDFIQGMLIQVGKGVVIHNGKQT